MRLEHKSFTFRVKAIDDDLGLIEAYGSVFNVVDQGDDEVKFGAFKRTIQNSKARVQAGKAKFLAMMLYQHDPDRPIGGWYDLVEDNHGLLAKGQIILTTQLGRETYELIKAGVINEFSIGYDIVAGGAKYNKESGVRELTELRLWEISPVTFAMNQDALLVGVKANAVMTEKKDFSDHYRQEALEDWLYSDFSNLVCALKSALLDEFSIGDEPESDTVTTVLDDGPANKQGFISALKAWVQKGIDLDASAYLQETLEAHGAGYYNYMSNRGAYDMDRKAGRAISAANAQTITDHIANTKAMANKALQMAADHHKAMQDHVKSMNAAADDLATVLQGSEAAYGTDAGTPEDGQQQGKSASYSRPGATRGAATSSSDDTMDDADLENALADLRSIRF